MYDTIINEYSGDFGKGRTVEGIVDWIEDLPSMPDVVTRAIRLVDDVNTTAEELAAVIMRDPALALPILRTANSAGQGQQQEVKSLDSAILVVGMGRIKTMLLASAMRRWNGNFGPVERLVWEKSIGAAGAALVLCQQQKKRYRDELYLTGLLHNLGQMVLLSHGEVGKLYPQVIQRMRELGEDFVTAERELIGFSHPLVGALVARKWGFPIETCQMILRYSDPFEGIDGEADEKLAMLKLAIGLALISGIGFPEGCAMDSRPEVNSLAGYLKYDPVTQEEELASALEETKTRFAQETVAYA